MGFMGFSTAEKIYKNCKKYLLPEQYKKLTVQMCKNVHEKYIELLINKQFEKINFEPSQLPIELKKMTKNSYALNTALQKYNKMDFSHMNAIMRSIYELAMNGTITMKEYSPLEYMSIDQAQKQAGLKSDFSFSNFFTKMSYTSIIVAGAIGYVLLKSYLPPSRK